MHSPLATLRSRDVSRRLHFRCCLVAKVFLFPPLDFSLRLLFSLLCSLMFIFYPFGCVVCGLGATDRFERTTARPTRCSTSGQISSDERNCFGVCTCCGIHWPGLGLGEVLPKTGRTPGVGATFVRFCCDLMMAFSFPRPSLLKKCKALYSRWFGLQVSSVAAGAFIW